MKYLRDYKKLVEEIDFNKNNINIEKISFGSKKEVWWKCKNGHEWKAKVSSRTRGHGCPYCVRVKVTEEDSIVYTNPELLKEWDFKKNKTDPKTISSGSNKKVWWICEHNHSWMTQVKHKKNGNGCPYCSGKKVGYGNSFAENNPELLKEFSIKNKISPYSFTSGSHKKVWWRCKNNHEWKATIRDRVRGKGCRRCCSRVSKACSEWLDDLNISSNKREKYITVDGIRFCADAYDEKTNTVYEYFGYFWHGHPDKYNRNDINPVNKKDFWRII